MPGRIPAIGEIARYRGKEYGVIGVANAQHFGVVLVAEAHVELAPMFAVPLSLFEYNQDDRDWKINGKKTSIITDIREALGG